MVDLAIIIKNKHKTTFSNKKYVNTAVGTLEEVIKKQKAYINTNVKGTAYGM